MSNSLVSIIVAMAENRAIGSRNKLLWHISEELKRFKQITMSHPIIMGRKTQESIGQPLPGRTNIVITKDPNYEAEDYLVAHSLEEALNLAQKQPGSEEIFIIGGGQIYEQALPLADKLYLTLVAKSFPEADTFFPDYSEFKKIVYEQEQESEGYRYKFLILEK